MQQPQRQPQPLAVKQPLECQECPQHWTDDSRWRAYLTSDDELLVYCPDCAAREFDSQPWRPRPQRQL